MAKTLAKVLGVIVLLVGILGFIPNPIVGEGGMLHTDTMHDAIHILVGLILVLCGTESKAKMWMKILGVVVLLLAVLGFMAAGNGEPFTILGIAEANTAGNWLHLVLGIVFLLVGFTGGKKMTAQMGGQQM